MTAMLRLLRAEWRKATGNLWMMGCLLGVWPLLGLLTVGALLLAGLAFKEASQQLALELRWNLVALDSWNITANLIAQLGAVAFAAILFGGEYRWRTWKNLAPRRRRLPLLLIKYVVLGVLMICALLVLSVVLVVGLGLVSAALGFGASYFQVGERTLGEFAANALVMSTSVFVGALFIGALVGLATLLTRSMLIGALGGIVVLAIDGFTPTAVSTIVLLTDTKIWLEALRLRFMYNLHNAGQLILGHAPASPGLIEFSTGTNSLLGSLVIVAVWLAVMIGLTLWVFQRQDLTD
ncbi:MAG: hypothetical protein JXB47_17610 [Anaerolineae bacterium]|nr:hypothetical protein [Anaerolineae bacterium]